MTMTDAAPPRPPVVEPPPAPLREGPRVSVAVVVTGAGLAVGLIAWAAGAPVVRDASWIATIVTVLVPLTWRVTRDLWHRETGVDVIALLAMAGSLVLGEYLAGAVIALMLTGGQELEAYAARRARRELSALLQRAPLTAQRVEGDRVVTVAADDVMPGDLLLVRPQETVAVDGFVREERAVLDESTVTGEARPVVRARGGRVASGAVNAGGPFRFTATARAADSTYAGIVALVTSAQESKAPFVRLADRYALRFVPLTLAIAGGAWAVSGDPVRALAVLVVATPCPLILAAPIAIVAGLSRSARRGVVVKDAGALEALAGADTVLLDKTGTVTAGRPHLAETVTFGSRPPEEVLRLAASLDQVSAHVFAAPLVQAAADRGLPLTLPTAVTEEPGLGIAGRVGGVRVAVGAAGWVGGGTPLPPAVAAAKRRADLEGASAVFVAVDGETVGTILLDDPLRPDAPRALAQLKAAGVRRTALLTGDREVVAEVVAAAAGVDGVLADRSPAGKVAAVRAARADGVTVMVGDGVNDAPALAAADVGVAMGARGATASSQSADVVITVDRLDRLPEAVRIAQRSRGIALQSVLVGMGLSLAAMVAAAAGLLTPVAGAMLQEGIDLAVIANALRALRGPSGDPTDPQRRAASLHFRDEHLALAPGIERLRGVADTLDALDPSEALARLEALRDFLVGDLLVHEHAEDEAFATTFAARGHDGEVAPLRRTHAEIERLVRALDRRIDGLPPEGPGPDDLPDLRRLLYGLSAIVRLHTDQEEELYVRDDDRSLVT